MFYDQSTITVISGRYTFFRYTISVKNMSMLKTYMYSFRNAAARLVCKAKKSDHIHPILETLHWLPVTHRIQYKISTICFNSISGTAPQYLSDLLQPYTPARQLRSASDTRTFVTPSVNTKTFGERSFPYAGPSVWKKIASNTPPL